ncbi:hypothetical protein BDN72DRAFT_963107 [Pluteus cervinus]|uniref:Uncharacterized protein n=1 Tax=Pluteus cervinus TaxID=181527 RepID=A0ACD3AGB1_9AGAR|nr:hypothetical protein BDN72DRAFT_963107 [Pluteus cervinus]
MSILHPQVEPTIRALNPPYDPHFEERSEIDKEILQLERQLHLLRVKRNSLIPISNLPTDVLVDIFTLATPKVEDKDLSPKRMAEISWVCGLWRKVALDHPILWTVISGSLSPMWKRAFIERSQPAGISIGVDRTYIVRDLMEILISELPRIRQLDLTNGSAHKSEPITNLPAPILQSVKLWGIELPEELFSGIAPCLMAIELIACEGFHFRSVPFAQLTELKLVRPNLKPSIIEWLTGLSSLPNLQHITLDDALDSSVPELASPLPHVDLPNLQFLTMNGFRETTLLCSILLCQISGHPNLVTHIKTSQLHEHLPEYLRLLTHLRVFEPSHSLSLHITYSYFNLLVLGPNEEVVTSIEVLSRGLGRDELVETLQQIPLDTLSSIAFVDTVGNAFPYPDEIWSDILSPLPNLRTMQLGNMYAAPFMSYLGSFDTSTTPPTTTPANDVHMNIENESDVPPALPFPALRSLTLEDLSGDMPWALSPQLAHSFWEAMLSFSCMKSCRNRPPLMDKSPVAQYPSFSCMRFQKWLDSTSFRSPSRIPNIASCVLNVTASRSSIHVGWLSGQVTI